MTIKLRDKEQPTLTLSVDNSNTWSLAWPRTDLYTKQASSLLPGRLREGSCFRWLPIRHATVHSVWLGPFLTGALPASKDPPKNAHVSPSLSTDCLTHII